MRDSFFMKISFFPSSIVTDSSRTGPTPLRAEKIIQVLEKNFQGSVKFFRARKKFFSLHGHGAGGGGQFQDSPPPLRGEKILHVLEKIFQGLEKFFRARKNFSLHGQGAGGRALGHTYTHIRKFSKFFFALHGKFFSPDRAGPQSWCRFVQSKAVKVSLKQ